MNEYRRWVLAVPLTLLSLGLLAGCSADAEPAAPGGNPAAGGAESPGTGAASGASNDSTGGRTQDEADSALAPFVGTWVVTSRDMTLNCDGTESSPEDQAGEVVFEATADGQLLNTMDDCQILYSVAGTTATAPPGQQCETQGEYNSAVIEVVRATFTISDGNTAHSDVEYNITAYFSINDTTLECVVYGTSQLSRKD